MFIMFLQTPFGLPLVLVRPYCPWSETPDNIEGLDSPTTLLLRRLISTVKLPTGDCMGVVLTLGQKSRSCCQPICAERADAVDAHSIMAVYRRLLI
ncbi:hypothetical protein AJ88_23315 [Mesorhizobium amorphae CCBAU 01583]|nr:hypothetical protein AJ88_23315 [Mesorhizobium amorphae CCBAU 01583]